MVAIINGWIVDHANGLPAVIMPDFLVKVFGAVQHTHSPWRHTR